MKGQQGKSRRLPGDGSTLPYGGTPVKWTAWDAA